MRGGSQGVKNKNYRLINGKPLMYFTIKQAIKAKIFDHIVVSTDSKKILFIMTAIKKEFIILEIRTEILNIKNNI